MFCFQCEQTAGCKACTGASGVCGKKADTAQLQDKLTGALIGLARATEGNENLVNSTTDRLVIPDSAVPVSWCLQVRSHYPAETTQLHRGPSLCGV